MTPRALSGRNPILRPPVRSRARRPPHRRPRQDSPPHVRAFADRGADCRSPTADERRRVLRSQVCKSSMKCSTRRKQDMWLMETVGGIRDSELKAHHDITIGLPGPRRTDSRYRRNCGLLREQRHRPSSQRRTVCGFRPIPMLNALESEFHQPPQHARDCQPCRPHAGLRREFLRLYAPQRARGRSISRIAGPLSAQVSLPR